MKTFLRVLGILAGLGLLVVIVVALLTPRMDRWGATDEEIDAAFPGDELVWKVSANLCSGGLGWVKTSVGQTATHAPHLHSGVCGRQS